MSLILEALRKSEAERRRGLPPDLHAELPPTPARRASTRVAWWWLGGAAMVALALAGWLASRTLQGHTDGTTAPIAVRERAPSSADATPSVSQNLPRITPPITAPAIPAPSPPQAAASVPPPPAAPAPAAQPDVAETTAPPSVQPPRTPADPGRPLELAELDPGARDALPPLRMSMHLWNEATAMRFAIIDGQRVAEGDTLGEARVARIERDGVVLQWQGRMIRVPVR